MSSRLGKIHHSKERKTIYVATNGVAMCGHQHTSARSAKRCRDALKRQAGSSFIGWYVKAYLPTNPRTEVPES